MPAFGKSGTCRILALRWSMLVMSSSSFNVEAGLPSGRNHLVHVNAFDARVGRPVPQAALEPFDRLGVAFGGDFHAAVGHVFHPAEDSFAYRGGLGEISEADALHTPANHISPRDSHECGVYHTARVRAIDPAGARDVARD